MRAYRRRRHLIRQSAALPEETRRALERLRIFRNGAIGLIALPVFAAFLILSLSSGGIRTNQAIAMAASAIIGLALGKYVLDRSMKVADEVLVALAAMDNTDPKALAPHATRSWKDAFAPWLAYRPPAALRWLGKLLRRARGPRFGFVRSILPDGLIPPPKSSGEPESRTKP